MRYTLTLTAVLLLPAAAQAQPAVCENGNLPGNPTAIYQVPGDGTVTDRRTGLTWKQCAEGQDASAGTCVGTAQPMAWAEALAHAGGHTFAGHGDWRLPNVRELRSLVEHCRTTPAINEAVFPDTPPSLWSSTPSRDGARAWSVEFALGLQEQSARSGAQPVRLVRGGGPAALERLPRLQGVALSGTPTDSGATVSATSSQAGTGHWLVLASGTAAPTPAQVRSAIGAVQHGSAPMAAGAATAFPVSGLAAGTGYDFYLVAESSTGQFLSRVAQVPFSTSALAACGSAHASTALLAEAPATPAELCRMGAASSVQGADDTWSWSCQASAGAPAQCQAPRGYTVSVSAGAGGSVSPAAAQTVAWGATPRFTLTPDGGHAIASVGGSCGGSLAGAVFTTQAVRAHCTVAPVFALVPPPPPPPPPPPDPGPQEPPAPAELHVTSPATVQIANPALPIVIEPGAGGAVLVLPGAGSAPLALAVRINGQALDVRALPGTRLQVASVQGQATLVLRVLQGWAELAASRAGQPLALAGEVLLRAASAGTRIEGVPLATGVLVGALLAPEGALAQLDTRGLLAGERLRIDAQGALAAIELGTLADAAGGNARMDAGTQASAPADERGGERVGERSDARTGVRAGRQVGAGLDAVPPGDALALPGLGAQVRFQAPPVQLQGAVARLGAGGWPAVLHQHARALGEALAPGASSSVQFDAQGLVHWRLGPWTAALAPLAPVRIDVRQPDGLAYTPGGLVQIVQSGLVLTLAPTLADWAGFVQALAGVSASASVQVTPEGVLVLRLDGARWALRPALLAQPLAHPVEPASFGVQAGGTLALQGTHAQRLPWALGDYASALATLAQALPGARLHASLAPEGALQVQLPGAGGAWQLLPQPQLRSTLLEPELAALFAGGQRWAIDEAGQLLLRLPTGVQTLSIVPAP